MKRILILMLLSFNTYAESFYLVCKGIEDLRSGEEKNLVEKLVGIKVTDSEVIYEDDSYGSRTNTFYKKTDLKIIFNEAIFLDDKAESYLNAEIDRISGNISITYANFLTSFSSYFDGTCKTSQEKAF